jgi:acyl-CoA thioesterase I
MSKLISLLFKFPYQRILLLIFLYTPFLFCCDQKEKQSVKEQLADTSEDVSIITESNKKVIVFFGNSITAGYRLDLSEAFPFLIGEFIDSLKLNYRVVNAGLSGETTSSGNSRVEWVLKNQVDIFVLELGSNDGLRGIKTEETRKNIKGIIDKVKNKYGTGIFR